MTASQGRRERDRPWLYPLVYLTITHSTIGLMVIVGLLGNPILAADIALVHGATVATFHALSANTRALLLGQSRALTVADILRLRLVLVVPLALAAYLLATGTQAAPWIVATIVLRRCGEWFNDLQLCDAEVKRRTRFALAFFILQSSLLAAAGAALVAGWSAAPTILTLWAVVPLGVALGLRKELRYGHFDASLRVLRRILPHAGSTAISGLSLYAFRLLVVLLVGKAFAGELFTAIALGSFLGTAYTNVFGPSLALREQRGGKGFPRAVKMFLAGVLGLGFALALIAALMQADSELLAKSRFFWFASGLSLVGGVVMVMAQRVRLRVMRLDDGRDVFGPEVLLHVALLISAPALVFVGGVFGAASLYLVNALLAYFFYASSEAAQQRIAKSDPRYLRRARFLIAFFLVFPLFFQLTSVIYRNPDLVIDSGGRLLELPLPASILACSLGLGLLADYRRASRSLVYICLFFATMFLSAIITKPEGAAFNKANLLLLVQCLLPTFGLVLGEMFEAAHGQKERVIERAFFWACGSIIVFQLASSWIQGQAVLTHWVGLFSVYQHHQFVPVVIACAFLISISALQSEPRYRPYVGPLLFALLIYCLAASSLLPIFVAAVGLIAFGANHLRALGWTKGVAVAIAGVTVGLFYLTLVLNSPDNILKPKLTSVEARQVSKSLACDPDLAKGTAAVAIREGDSFLIRGQSPSRGSALVECRPRSIEEGYTLLVEGEVRRGSVEVEVLSFPSSAALLRRTADSGKLRVEFRPDGGEYRALITSQAPSGTAIDVTVSRIEWIPPLSDRPALVREVLPERLLRLLPLNLVDRISDWILFGRPVFSSAETFLFGHTQPMPRSVRTSAHNYYIDLAYNFGVLALFPIAGLLSYTVRQAWRRRREVLLDHQLLWLVAIVMFLLLVDSSLKVTLRQPYSGIFAFFVWGVLLARLRRPAEGK